MKILFIHPGTGWFEVAENTFFTTGGLLPPLGSLYLSRILIDNGHTPEVIDCAADMNYKESIKNSLNSCDAVGLTIYSQPEELKNSTMIAKYIKELDPNIPILIGGPHSSLLPEMTLKAHNADICVKGDGIDKILPIIEALNGKKELSKIPGIYYKSGKKILNNTPERREKIDIDSIPFPSRYLVDKYEYGHLFGEKISEGKLTSISTSKGCSASCRFCNLRAFIKTPRFRSVENVTREIEEIVEQGYKTIVFVDDNFMMLKDRVDKIMDFIINKNYNIKLWIFGARADTVDKKLWVKMKKAGVEFMSFGFESGDQTILNYYNKKLTIEKMKKALQLSKEMGFFIATNYIIGAPIETKETIQKTINFARSSCADSAIFYLFTYTYKSKIWQEAVDQGKIKPDEFRSYPDINKGLGNFTREELMEYIIIAYKRFYINPSYWFREIKWAITHGKLQFIKLGLRMLILPLQ